MAARVSFLHVGALLAVLFVAIVERASSAKVKVFRPGLVFSRPVEPAAEASDEERGAVPEGGARGGAGDLSGAATSAATRPRAEDEADPSFDDSAAASHSDPTVATAEGPSSLNGRPQGNAQGDERQSDDTDDSADLSGQEVAEQRRRPRHADIFQSPVLLEGVYKLFDMVDGLVDSLKEQEAEVAKTIDDRNARRAYDQAERLRSRRRVQMGTLVKRAKELRAIGLEQFGEAPKAAEQTIETIRSELGGALPQEAARALAAEPISAAAAAAAAEAAAAAAAAAEAASDDKSEAGREEESRAAGARRKSPSWRREEEVAEARPNKKRRRWNPSEEKVAAEARPRKKRTRWNPSEATFSTRSVPKSLTNFAGAVGMLANEIYREADEAVERVEESGESLLEDLRQAVEDSHSNGAQGNRWWRQIAEERALKLVEEAIALKREADQFVKEKGKDLDGVVQLVEAMEVNSEKRIGLISQEAAARISKRRTASSR